MSTEEKQMRWIQPMLSMQGRQHDLCLWVRCLHSLSKHRGLLLTGCSERRKSHKIYPNGYAEMLEQQQIQLVSGLREMYLRLQKASAWDGTHLDESSGHPLAHDILAALNLLESKHDGSGEMEAFEENCEKLHSRLASEGTGFARRRGSSSSDSGHSHQSQPWTTSSHNTLARPKPSLFTEDSTFPSATSSPPTRSSIPRSRLQPQPQPQQPQQHHTPLPIKLSPLHKSTANNNPQFCAPEWAHVLAESSGPEQLYQATHATEAPDFHNLLSSPWDPLLPQFGSPNFSSHFPAYQEQMDNGDGVGSSNGLWGINDLGPLDTLDIDFSKFVQPQERIT